jgi:AP-1-like transcription factor
LETKVGELEKLSESQNHENSLLRAQVERQQVELREYKKRLSVPAPTTSSSFSSYPLTSSTASTMIPNAFSFDFPQFSSLSYLPIDTSGQQPLFDMNLTTSPTTASRHGSADLLSNMSTMAPSPGSDALRSLKGSISGDSPGSTVPAPPEIWGRRDYNIFASPKNTAVPPPAPSRTDSDIRRGIFQFNTESSSSPSQSSTSQGHGASSSCETSPESTAHATTIIKEEQTSPNTRPEANEDWKNNTANDFGTFSNVNTGAENMPLWVDLPNNSVMGDGSFTGGFFNDVMPSGIDYTPMDWSDLITGSSARTGLTPAVQKSNPMEDMTVMPSITENAVSSHTSPGKKDFSACNKIW